MMHKVPSNIKMVCQGSETWGGDLVLPMWPAKKLQAPPYFNNVHKIVQHHIIATCSGYSGHFLPWPDQNTLATCSLKHVAKSSALVGLSMLTETVAQSLSKNHEISPGAFQHLNFRANKHEQT